MSSCSSANTPYLPFAYLPDAAFQVSLCTLGGFQMHVSIHTVSWLTVCFCQGWYLGTAAGPGHAQCSQGALVGWNAWGAGCREAQFPWEVGISLRMGYHPASRWGWTWRLSGVVLYGENTRRLLVSHSMHWMCLSQTNAVMECISWTIIILTCCI